jgi:hypothetical protein
LTPERTLSHVGIESAVEGKADATRTLRNVCIDPNATFGRLRKRDNPPAKVP